MLISLSFFAVKSFITATHTTRFFFLIILCFRFHRTFRKVARHLDTQFADIGYHRVFESFSRLFSILAILKRRRGTRKAGKEGVFHPRGLGTFICIHLILCHFSAPCLRRPLSYSHLSNFLLLFSFSCVIAARRASTEERRGGMTGLEEKGRRDDDTVSWETFPGGRNRVANLNTSSVFR